MREGEAGDARRYLELAEAMEEKYLRYQAVLGVRKRAVSQLEIAVEAAGEDAPSRRSADLVTEWLRREELEDELFDLLDALGKGYSVTEILWETSAKQWLPARLAWRDPRWFTFDRASQSQLRLRTESDSEDLPPFKFICHKHRAKSGLPIRGGLARGAAWAYLFTNYALKDWAIFAEVYGQPLRLGKYPPEATQEDKDVLRRAVANIGADAGAIVPTTMLLEFVQASSSGGGKGPDLYRELCRYWDEHVTLAVLGQNLTTEVKGGSFAAAAVHDRVRGDIMRSDARQLAATLNRDLVRPLVNLNFGPQKAYPRLILGLPDEWSKEKVEAVGAMVDRGLAVGQGQARRKLGVDDPQKEDSLLYPVHSPDPDTPGPVTASACPSCGMARSAPAVAAQAEARERPDDAIEALLDQELEDWEELVAPLVDPVERLLGESKNLEEFQDRLVQAIGEMKPEQLAELLARAGFGSRAAGDAGVDLG